MEPISELSQLNFRLVFDVEDQGVDAVGVPNKVVVGHVVRLHTGKLPNAQFAGLPQIALKKSGGNLLKSSKSQLALSYL